MKPSNVQPICLSVRRPSEVYVDLTLTILTLLASIQLYDNLFHSCTVLCENENF